MKVFAATAVGLLALLVVSAVGNITGVSTAESTTQALTQTRTAVDELSRMAADLRSTVGAFNF